MIGYVTWKDYDVAKRELNVFTARATEAMKDEQFDRAMRYALSAYVARGSISWFTPFSTELEGKRNLQTCWIDDVVADAVCVEHQCLLCVVG